MAATKDQPGMIAGARQKLSQRKHHKRSRRESVTTGTGQVATGHISKLSRYGAWAALIVFGVSGFTGCTYSVLSSGAEPVVEQTGNDPAAQNAGAYAAGFVGAWMDATASEHAALDSYYTAGGAAFPSEAVSYKDLTVASTESQDHGMTTVIVAASTQVTEQEDGKETTRWVPRRYQVVVAEREGELTPMGYPAPVSAPEAGEVPQVDYTNRSTSQQLAGTVEDFFTAYGAGSGDVDRYISPGAEITAITPAPYDAARVTELATRNEVSDDAPADGDTAQAKATVAYSQDDSTRTADYLLSLTARGGRWEITAIDSAPAIQTQ